MFLHLQHICRYIYTCACMNIHVHVLLYCSLEQMLKMSLQTLYVRLTLYVIHVHVYVNPSCLLLQYESACGVSLTWPYFITVISLGSVLFLNLWMGVLTRYSSVSVYGYTARGFVYLHVCTARLGTCTCTSLLDLHMPPHSESIWCTCFVLKNVRIASVASSKLCRSI